MTGEKTEVHVVRGSFDVFPSSMTPTGSGPAARRVLVVEDDTFTRGLLTQALTGRGYQVHSVDTATEAARCFADTDPDALIIDVHLGAGVSGIHLANVLKAKAPWLAVVAVSNYPNPESAGLPNKLPDDATFLNKSSIESPQVLIDALEAVLTNSAHVSHMRVDADSPLVALTPTQMEVLRLIATGWSNTEIAKQRRISVRSVEQMIHRIFTALGVNDDARKTARVEAVKLYAQAFGLPSAGE